MSTSSRKPGGPSTSRPLWQEAASFAARRHNHQVRRDGRTPYFAHPVRVMMTVAHVFGFNDENTLCAALLHDTIEDTLTDYDDILEKFGAEVADIVAALTKNMALPESTREREYDARLAKADWRVRLIKLADTYDNFCDVATQAPEKVAQKRADAIDKCRRALKLAAKDVRKNATMRRAARAVEELVAGAGAKQ